MADDPTFYDAIEAYPERLSVQAGEPVRLCVSTTAPRYRATVERWGAERSGTVRELRWESDWVDGVHHPVPDDADAKGCRWPVALEIPTGADWASGFHLVTLTAEGAPEGRDTAHAGFVVRAPEPTTSAIMVLATNTWNAYNNWGGCSLYTGGVEVSFRRPFARGMLCRPHTERDDRKARPIRWDEAPDADGEIFQAWRTERGYPPAIGSSGWFTYERRFVAWAEAAGHRFDMAISTDLETPGALDGYDLVICVGHDEYWSAPQREAVEAHVAGGGNLATFSGNTMFWQVRTELEATSDGTDGPSSMIGYKYTAHTDDPILDTDPTRISGMWADPVVGKPEAALLGGGSAWGLYHRFGQATARGIGAFVVYRNDHWLFEGTDLRYGDVLGARDGVVGYETLGCRIQFDEYQLPVRAGGDHTPDDLEIVAFCPSSNLRFGEYPASISALSDQGDLDFIASRLFGRIDDDSVARIRHGNAVIVTCRPYADVHSTDTDDGPGGGEVVTIGTTDWAFGLAADPDVGTVTDNVLRRLSRRGQSG